MNQIFDDFPVVSVYTRAQALEDGVIVDLNQIIPVHESGYKYPIACTAAVWSIIETAVNNKKFCNDYAGVVWDILHMSRNYQIKKWQTGAWFKVIITGTGRKKIHTFKIECHGGDNAEPVLTVMLPEED